MMYAEINHLEPRTARQFSVELERTLVICFFQFFGLWGSVFLFNTNVGIGFICFGLLSGECLAQVGQPWKRKFLRQEPTVGDDSTSGYWEEDLFQNSSSGHFKTYMDNKKKQTQNILKSLCVTHLVIRVPYLHRLLCFICSLEVQEVSLFVELNSEGFIVGKS